MKKKLCQIKIFSGRECAEVEQRVNEFVVSDATAGHDIVDSETSISETPNDPSPLYCVTVKCYAVDED